MIGTIANAIAIARAWEILTPADDTACNVKPITRIATPHRACAVCSHSAFRRSELPDHLVSVWIANCAGRDRMNSRLSISAPIMSNKTPTTLAIELARDQKKTNPSRLVPPKVPQAEAASALYVVYLKLLAPRAEVDDLRYIKSLGWLTSLTSYIGPNGLFLRLANLLATCHFANLVEVSSVSCSWPKLIFPFSSSPWAAVSMLERSTAREHARL